MSSRAESTASVAASPPPPPAPPPRVDPLEAWTAFRPFRETFLRHFTAEGHRDALETVGKLVFTMAMEYNQYWPDPTEDDLVEELRAVAADLRYLHGALYYLVKESGRDSMADPRREIWLLANAGTWADTLGELADEMDGMLAE